LLPLIVAALGVTVVVTGGPGNLYVVHTGSMSPTLRPGDAVLDAPAGRPHVGQVVTFRMPGEGVVTHRVVRASRDDVRTKGDANRTADAWRVPNDDVVGVVRHRLPYVGYAIVYLQQPTGAASVIAILVSLLLAWRLFFPLPEPTRQPSPSAMRERAATA
jgi:signal peptidase